MQRKLDNYSLLAKYYDELLIDPAQYALWLPYIEEGRPHTILELASGSGNLAKLLSEKGYEVTASDLSVHMQEIARENGFTGEYLKLDMSHFDLGRKFDCILSTLDSINYLEEDELDDFFASCYAHLNEGGRLVFDVHDPVRIREFEEEYIEEGLLSDQTGYQWTILSDPYASTLMENFVFFTEEGTIIEHHQQTVYQPELLKKKMEAAGFKVRVVKDFIPEEKILFTGGR